MTDPDRAAGRTVERTLTLAAPKDAVWRALTDANELTRWFPLEARVDPGVGGTMWMSWGDLYSAESTIQIWEPGRQLRTAFPNHQPYHMATDYYLEGEGGTTVLRVVTSGFGRGADWDRMYGGVKRGWDFELAGLRLYLERHRGRDRSVALARRPLPGTAAELWPALFGTVGPLSISPNPPAEGAAVELSIDPGDPIAGRLVVWDPPYQVALVAESLNHGLLRLELEAHTTDVHAMLWVSTYDLPVAQVETLTARFDRVLDGLARRVGAA